MKFKNMFTVTVLSALFTGCYSTSTVINEAGKKSVYEDVGTISKETQGTGIESQDIVQMVDKMMRDIVSTGFLVNRANPPRIIIDSKYFKNQSTSRINKNLITERLLINLNRAAKGRMIFIEREDVSMVIDERELKRDGEVSTGALGNAKKVLGADFRLSGKIMSLDTLDNRSGMESRYHQISFKLVDLETSALVWTNMYEFKKSSAANVIYR
jgi:PBP1b-binding outer membrane lipoprotein LpoB